jgi:hypothetical protein
MAKQTGKKAAPDHKTSELATIKIYSGGREVESHLFIRKTLTAVNPMNAERSFETTDGKMVTIGGALGYTIAHEEDDEQ